MKLDRGAREALLRALVAPLEVVEAVRQLYRLRSVNKAWKEAVDNLKMPGVVPEININNEETCTTGILHPNQDRPLLVPAGKTNGYHLTDLFASVCSFWPAFAQITVLKVGFRRSNGSVTAITAADLSAAAKGMPHISTLHANLLVEDPAMQTTDLTAALSEFQNLQSAMLVFCASDLRDMEHFDALSIRISGMQELKELHVTLPSFHDHCGTCYEASLEVGLTDCPKVVEVKLGGVLSTYNFQPSWRPGLGYSPVMSCSLQGPSFGQGCHSVQYFSIDGQGILHLEDLLPSLRVVSQDFKPRVWVLGTLNGETIAQMWGSEDFWAPVVRHILQQPGLERLVLRVEGIAEGLQSKLEEYAEDYPEVDANAVMNAVVLVDYKSGAVIPWQRQQQEGRERGQ
jgi:hypothetical protein